MHKSVDKSRSSVIEGSCFECLSFIFKRRQLFQWVRTNNQLLFPDAYDMRTLIQNVGMSGWDISEGLLEMALHWGSCKMPVSHIPPKNEWLEQTWACFICEVLSMLTSIGGSLGAWRTLRIHCHGLKNTQSYPFKPGEMMANAWKVFIPRSVKLTWRAPCRCVLSPLIHVRMKPLLFHRFLSTLCKFTFLSAS